MANRCGLDPTSISKLRCGRWCLSSFPHTIFTVLKGATISTLRMIFSRRRKSAPHNADSDLPVPGALRHSILRFVVMNAEVCFWCSIASTRAGQ